MKFRSEWLDPKLPLKYSRERERVKRKVLASWDAPSFNHHFFRNFGVGNSHRKNAFSVRRVIANATTGDVPWVAPWNDVKRIRTRLIKRGKQAHDLPVNFAIPNPFGATDIDRDIMELASIADKNFVTITSRMAVQSQTAAGLWRLPTLATVNPAACWWCAWSTSLSQCPRLLLPASMCLHGAVDDPTLGSIRSLAEVQERLGRITSSAVVGLTHKSFFILLRAWTMLGTRDASIEGALIVGFGDHAMSLSPIDFAVGLRTIAAIGLIKAMESGDLDTRHSLAKHCTTAFTAERISNRLYAVAPYHAQRSPDRLVEMLYTASLVSGCGGVRLVTMMGDVPSYSNPFPESTEAEDDPDRVSTAFIDLYYRAMLNADTVARLRCATSVVFGYHLIAPAVCGMLQIDAATGLSMSRVVMARQWKGLDIVIDLIQRFETLVSLDGTHGAVWDALGFCCVASVGVPLAVTEGGIGSHHPSPPVIAQQERTSLVHTSSTIVERAIRDRRGRVRVAAELVPPNFIEAQKGSAIIRPQSDDTPPTHTLSERRYVLGIQLSKALDTACRILRTGGLPSVPQHVVAEAVYSLRCCTDSGIESDNIIATRDALEASLSSHAAEPLSRCGPPSAVASPLSVGAPL